jgi:hypothetical protein
VTVKQASGITLKHFNFKGASTAVAYSDYSAAGVCEWVRVEDGAIGFSANGQNVSLALAHCSVVDATSQGVYAQNSAVITMDHSVLWNNRYGINVNAGTCRITNSVVGVTGSARYAYDLGTSGTIIVTNNNITRLPTGPSLDTGKRPSSGVYIGSRRLDSAVMVMKALHVHRSAVRSPDANDSTCVHRAAAGRYVVSSDMDADFETSHLVDAGVGHIPTTPRRTECWQTWCV